MTEQKLNIPTTLTTNPCLTSPTSQKYQKSVNIEESSIALVEESRTASVGKSQVAQRNFSAEFPILSSFGSIINPDSDTSICIQEDNIQEVMTIINCVENRNLFLRGKAGVGKTATIYALAQHLASGKCGARLQNMVIAQLNLSLIKGNSNSAGIEKNITDIWNEAKRDENVILFIDEGHRIATGGADSIGNILKPLVTNGKVPVILATTEDEFRKYIDPDPALKRRFHPVQIPEPKGETLLTILKSKGATYAQKFNVNISDEIYKKTIELADRYIHETANPEKSIRLLERACSTTSLRADGANVIVQDLEVGLKMIAKVRVAKNKNSSASADITAELRQKIKGQDFATEKAGEFISQYFNGFFSNDMPTLALLGPCGCGKSSLAMEIAKKLGFSENEIVEIKMAGLQGYNSMAILLGAKDEHNNTPGRLTEPVRKNPNRFIIIDEIEKMPDEAIPIFEQMLTTGTVIDSNGNDVSFKNVVVVFTGDMGKVKQFGFSVELDMSEKIRQQENEMSRLLREKFSGSFCSNIVPFSELSKSVVMDVIRLECSEFSNFGIRFEISDEACEFVADLCEYKKYGAREVHYRLSGLLRKFSSLFNSEVKTACVVLENGELKAVPKEEPEILLNV